MWLRGLLQWWDWIALSQHKLFFCLWPFQFLGEVGYNLVSPPNMCTSVEYYSYNRAQKEGGISIGSLAASAQTERSWSCTQPKMWQPPSSFKTVFNGLLLSLLFEELLQTAASLPEATWCADVSQLWLSWQGSYHQGTWGIFAMGKTCKTKHFPCQNSRGNGIALLQLLINQSCYICRA